MTEPLKPCPFCGSKPVETFLQISCRNEFCAAGPAVSISVRGSKAKTRAAWNSRRAEPAPDEVRPWKMLDDLGPGMVLGQWDAGGYDDDHRWAVWEMNAEPTVYYFGRTPQAAIENATNKTKGEDHP
jgi:hypothetical protein